MAKMKTIILECFFSFSLFQSEGFPQLIWIIRVSLSQTRASARTVCAFAGARPTTARSTPHMWRLTSWPRTGSFAPSVAPPTLSHSASFVCRSAHFQRKTANPLPAVILAAGKQTPVRLVLLERQGLSRDRRHYFYEYKYSQAHVVW